MKRKKKIKILVFALLFVILSLLNTSYAYTLTIENTIYGNEEDINYNKVFKYKLLETYQCVGCGYRTLSYDEIIWHMNPNNTGSHTTSHLIWKSSDINLKNDISTTVQQGSEANYYAIEVLEPRVDSDGNHYQISYQIDNNPIQHLSAVNDNKYSKIIINDITKNTTIKFYYYLTEVPPTGISPSLLSLIMPFSLLGIITFVFYKLKRI